MLTSNKQLDKKIQEYLDHQFAGVKETQQLFHLKEELYTNLKERVSDLMKRGSSEEEAFKEAVINMGDLSGLVEDMRVYGQDTARQSVDTKAATRVFTVGMIAGLLSLLIGAFLSPIVYFIFGFPILEPLSIAWMFTVIGVMLLTYSLLTRETAKRYAMNKIRALLYAVASGSIVCGLFLSGIAYSATGEVFIAITSMMIWFLIGFGLLLYLVFTGKSRLKKRYE